VASALAVSAGSSMSNADVEMRSNASTGVYTQDGMGNAFHIPFFSSFMPALPRYDTTYPSTNVHRLALSPDPAGFLSVQAV
jgi:hypothetical protein